MKYETNTGADLRGAILSGADLRGAPLEGADLSGASLDGASMQGAALHRADLKFANLEFASLERSDLTGADLTGANLRGADLRCAIFRHANLRGADLRGADIDGADFACADLTGAKLDDGAYWTLRTRSTHAQPTAQAGAGEKMTNEKTGTELATQRSSALSDPEKLSALTQFAAQMAECRVTIPQHLVGKPGDCLAVAMQAENWGMNPFAVAQKTHLINGTLGYEAQLVNAVITSMAPTTGRLNFEWFGPWEKIVGKFKTLTGKSGKPYQAPAWSQADEAGCGVRVWATLRGETEPRVLELLLQQATVRNSTLWASDPKQQLAYLATKRWARLYTPDVILGVYTPDELEQRAPIDVTPVRVDESASAADRLKSRIADTNMPKPEDVTPISRDDALDLIGAADSLDSLSDIAEEIKVAGLGGDKSLRDAWSARRAQLEVADD